MEKLHLIHRVLVPALVWGLSGCLSPAQLPAHSDASEAKEIVARQFDQWKNGKASFFELLAYDVEWVVSGRSPVSGRYHGKTDFVERAVSPITSNFQTPLQPELISLTADGEFVWLHFIATATTHTKGLYENTYVWKLRLQDGKIIEGTAFLDTHELTKLMNNDTAMKTIEETEEYIGMWVTADGYIRHELLPENRYDEARGTRKSAYQGSYKISGNHIDYKDDTGFTADGEFKDGILYHAGMIL